MNRERLDDTRQTVQTHPSYHRVHISYGVYFLMLQLLMLKQYKQHKKITLCCKMFKFYFLVCLFSRVCILFSNMFSSSNEFRKTDT